MMPRAILHIGQHKTGSKALQSALYANRTYLAESGFAYPVPANTGQTLRPWQMSHFGLYEAVRAGGGVGNYVSSIIKHCPVATKTLVLSAEDLFDMHTAHEPCFEMRRIPKGCHLLAKELAPFAKSVRIVCYLRRQDHLLAAHYAQLIKGTNIHHPSFREFCVSFAPRLHFFEILSHWEAAFGTAAITVVPYEPPMMSGGIVTDFFSRALGLKAPAVTAPFPDDLEASNVTPTRDYIEFMRCLNRRSSLGKSVLPREVVLESAFRDKAGRSVNIAAWMSPGERATILGRHAEGNQQVASNYCIQGGLFREPLPTPEDAWGPYPEPGLRRLVELDAMARAVMKERRGHSVGPRVSYKARLVLWIVSPQVMPSDERIATELFGGIAGRPNLESAIVRKFEPRKFFDHLGRLVLVVFVGPTAGRWANAALSLGLGLVGVRVLRVQDGAIYESFRARVRATPKRAFLLIDEILLG
jgi:hypothetical protein